MRSLLSIFSFKNRDPLTGIILFVVLVIASEAAFSFLPKNALVKSFHVSRVPAGAAADIQIMGDSAAQGGIVADQLSKALTDKTVYNYAIAATGPEFPYFILKREIDAGKAPKLVIYAPSPHTFGSLRIPLLIGGFCDWRETFEVASAGYQPIEVIYGLLCKLSYTLRNRERLAQLIKGDRPAVQPVSKAMATEAKPMSRAPRYTIETLHPQYKKPFSIEPFNKLYFEKFLNLAREHHIKIYWATLPILQTVLDCRKQYGFDSDYYQFLDGLRDQYGIEFLQRDFLIYGEDDFKDHIHLNEEAARRFTAVLESRISKTEDASAMSAVDVSLTRRESERQLR